MSDTDVRYCGGAVWKLPPGGYGIIVLLGHHCHDPAGVTRMGVAVFGAPGNMLAQIWPPLTDDLGMGAVRSDELPVLLAMTRCEFVGFGLDLLDAEECGRLTRKAAGVRA